MSKKVVDYTKYFSVRSLRRKPSPIRALQPLVSLPGMVSLGGGMPNPALFPFKALDIHMTDGTTLKLESKSMREALQYSPTPGLPELISRLEQMQRIEHHPPEGAQDFAVSVGTGSQDLLAKAFDEFIEEGTSVITETPTYSGSLAYLKSIDCQIVETPTDTQGLQPDSLDTILDKWNTSNDTAKPKVLYTIPTGANPTGASMDIKRRHALYEVAQKHDLLVLEDDPYYYLQFTTKRLPSLFSMDTDGRVLRFDSFSKLLSAGIRMGVVTGPEPLVERINLHTQASNLHPSGVSQALTLALFQHWHVGEQNTPDLGQLENHIQNVVQFYSNQCDAFMSAAKTVGLDQYCDYERPTAGMFVWMRVKPELGIGDTAELIQTHATKHKFLMLPGSVFSPSGKSSPYVRAAFSTASHEEMQTALGRFVTLLKSLCQK